MPRTQSTTSPPQSLAQRPPAAIPAAKLRPLPADSPLPAPSSQIKATLGSPAPARAKPPPRGPRTGPPAANRRRAHQRPGFLPRRRPVRQRRQTVASSPPPLSLTCGLAVTPSLPRAHAVSLARGPQLGRRPRARVPRAWLGRNSPPARLAGNSFFFFFFFSHFFSPFSYIYLYADILCTKNSPNKL
jgi:hypothetical protein